MANFKKIHPIVDASMAADVEVEIDISLYTGYAVQFVWTGAPEGNVIVQATIDGTNFETIPSGSQACGGAAGTHLFNVDGAYYAKVKLFYDRTSGTGTLNAYLSAKE